MFAIW